MKHDTNTLAAHFTSILLVAGLCPCLIPTREDDTIMSKTNKQIDHLKILTNICKELGVEYADPDILAGEYCNMCIQHMEGSS